MKKLILIDANALVHRAFHALPPLTSPQGMIVNAVYGFISVLLKTIKDLKPDCMAAAFDLAGPTFRHEEFEEYKAHRPKAPDELYAQIPLIKEALKNFGVEIFEQEGFEADDLIGSVAEQAKKTKDLQTIILTGDLDTLQLVEGDKVVVFTLRKGVSDMVIYDENAVKERYGLEPYQVIDFKGLKGDPSDNIPGVLGIGEKTAITLLQKYGTIENLYKELKKVKDFKKGEVLTAKLAEKLKENENQAVFSKRLATIIRDVKVDFSLEKVSWREKFDKEKTLQFLKSLGFNSLLNRLPEKEAEKGEELIQTGFLLSENRGVGDALAVKTDRELNSLFTKAQKEKIVYLLLNYGNLFLLAGEDLFSTPEEDIGKLKVLFENTDIAKRGHDLKNLLKVMLSKNINPVNFDFDTAIAAYLLRSDLKDYELGKIYFLEFGQQLGGGAREQIISTQKLAEVLWDRLKGKNLVKILEEIEMPLIPVLAEMENNGIKIDTSGLKVLSEKVNQEISKLEKKIYEFAGEEFNINSPQQLGVILFDKLLLKTKVKKTSGGARSTAAAEPEKLADEHPVIWLIVQYRELQKLKTTYIDPFPSLVAPLDQRLHTSYNQTGTVTGRLSSQNPNLQNIPIRTELGQEFRKAFVSEEGYDLVSLDYSQIELRIAAYFSNDQKMLEAFKNNEDIHTRTASEVFEVVLAEVKPEMRREAKALNFGILFGMGPLGFARSAGIDKMKAREFITKYLKKFSGMAAYMDKVKEEARQKGFVKTYFGRRRELPEINSGLPQLVAQAERMAINAPIQGTEADIMKLAMIKISNFIKENKLERKARILLQVHDELLCEVEESSVRELVGKFKKIMEEIWPASQKLQRGEQVGMPIVVDVKAGKNWASLK